MQKHAGTVPQSCGAVVLPATIVQGESLSKARSLISEYEASDYSLI